MPNLEGAKHPGHPEFWASPHLFEITSLQFMLVCVPLPVWNTTRGKWSSSFPSITCLVCGTIHGNRPKETSSQTMRGGCKAAHECLHRKSQQRAFVRSGLFSFGFVLREGQV